MRDPKKLVFGLCAVLLGGCVATRGAHEVTVDRDPCSDYLGATIVASLIGKTPFDRGSDLCVLSNPRCDEEHIRNYLKNEFNDYAARIDSMETEPSLHACWGDDPTNEKRESK